MSLLTTTDRKSGPAGTWVQRHVRISTRLHSRVRGEDKLQFLQQLSTLLSAGTPLLEALRVAASQSQSQKMRKVVRTVAERVAAGQSLHQAVADFPNVFERQWIEVMKTGEISGRLGEVLATLTGHALAARELRRKLVSAMIYPCILVVVAVLAIAVMLWVVVPTFADFFEEFDSTLPAITQSVIDLSAFVQQYGLYIVAVLVGLVLAVRHYLRTSGGKRLFDQLVLTAPMIGECVVQAQMAKFATNAVLLLRSGLPLLDTISALQGVFHGNTVYVDGLRSVEQRLACGVSLAAALEETGLFTTMVVSMVRVGEESGELTHVLDEVAVYYTRRVEALVERLTKIIEPAVILGMGVTVALVLLSIYLPMFQMASGTK